MTPAVSRYLATLSDTETWNSLVLSGRLEAFVSEADKLVLEELSSLSLLKAMEEDKKRDRVNLPLWEMRA